MANLQSVAEFHERFTALAKLPRSGPNIGRLIQMMRAGSNIRVLHELLDATMPSEWKAANGVGAGRLLMMAFAISYCPHVVFPPPEENDRPLSPASRDSQRELEHMAQATLAALTTVFPTTDSAATTDRNTAVFRDRLQVFVQTFTEWKKV